MTLDYPEDLAFFEAVLAELAGAATMTRRAGADRAPAPRRPDLVAINAALQEEYWRRFNELYPPVELAAMSTLAIGGRRSATASRSSSSPRPASTTTAIAGARARSSSTRRPQSAPTRSSSRRSTRASSRASDAPLAEYQSGDARAGQARPRCCAPLRLDDERISDALRARCQRAASSSSRRRSTSGAPTCWTSSACPPSRSARAS